MAKHKKNSVRIFWGGVALFVLEYYAEGVMNSCPIFSLMVNGLAIYAVSYGLIHYLKEKKILKEKLRWLYRHNPVIVALLLSNCIFVFVANGYISTYKEKYSLSKSEDRIRREKNCLEIDGIKGQITSKILNINVNKFGDNFECFKEKTLKWIIKKHHWLKNEFSKGVSLDFVYYGDAPTYIITKEDLKEFLEKLRVNIIDIEKKYCGD